MFFVRCICAAAIFSLVGLTLPVSAQSPVQYTVDRWNTDAGLPQNSVNAMLQSRDGRLWLATFGGIARFDGTIFSAITTGDRSGLRSDRAHALAEDREGRIWIGTEEGLSRYDHGTITTFTTKNGLPDNFVRAVAAYPDGSVWFGMQGGALGQIAADGAGHLRIAVPPHGTFGGTINNLLVDAGGALWINAESGVWRMDSGSAAPVLVQTRANPQSFGTPITADPHDGVWMTTEAGVIHFGRSGSKTYPIPASARLASADIRALVSDGAGVLWLGSMQSELWRFRPDSGDIQLIKSSEQGTTTELLRDREGSIWVGNRVGGLVRIRPALFQVFTTNEGLAHDNAVAVFTDSKGRVWAGAKCDGVAIYQDGQFRKLPPAETPECVWTIAEDMNGDIWMGGKGLGRLHNGKFEILDSAAGVRAIFRDRQGTMWVGSQSGLSSWDGAHFQTHPGRAPDLELDVRTIYQTRDGVIWIGTLHGLMRYANGEFEAFTTAQGLPFDDVRAIYEDAGGALWIGTYGGGLARFYSGQFKLFGTADGLTDNFLSSIAEDNSGNLWLSGNRGIFRVARRELEQHAGGLLSRIHCVVYGRSDGMLSTETNGGFQPAVTRTSDGRLWYPTLVGVAVIDPAAAISDIAPAVALERVLVNGQPREPEGELFIPPGPGSDDVEIQYSGLSLNAPNAVTFRYRLDDWDRNWVDAGTRRSAVYSHLVPGTYHFRVMAANRDGVWSGENSGLALTVLPHPWQTWWFRTFALLALVSAPLLRDRHLRRREAILTRAVEQKTSELREQAKALEKQNELLAENVRLKDDVERISRHDLRTPLNSIIALAQIVREAADLPSQHAASLQLIEQAGYRAMNMASLTLDLFKMEQGGYRLNPCAVHIRTVAERVLLDLQALSRTREVTAEILVEDGEAPLIYGDELLTHSMLGNLVKNAIEASPTGGHVVISIVNGERVRIRIHNRGAIPESMRDRFFEKYATEGKPEGTGLGAYSAKLMAETQGGRIQVETSEETGTAITVELLPAAAANLQKTAAPEGIDSERMLPSVEAWPKRTLLIVDDDFSNRAILRHYLSHPNWTVDEAENGPLALRKVTEKTYDFIFLDVEMPVMDGFELTRRLRALEHLNVQIAALSSHDDPAIRERALQSGCDRYLTKPVTRKTIVEMVLGSAAVIVLDADIRDLVPAFLEKQKEEIARVQAAAANGGGEAVRHGGHRMRGSFSLYGFNEAAALCGEVEELAQADRLAEAGRRLTSLSSYLNNIEIRYQAH